MVDDDNPLAALHGTAGLRVRFSDQPQGAHSTLPGGSTSRNQASTRPASSTPGDVGEVSPTKKLKPTPVKKLKLRQIEVEEKIRTISCGGENYYIVDEDMPEVEEEINDHDDWLENEDEGSGGVPECFWFDGPVDVVPPTPQVEVDRAADAFEVERLTKMGVMRLAATSDKEIQKVLTARFVYDWRLETRDLGERKAMCGGGDQD